MSQYTTDSHPAIAPPSVETARIVSDVISLEANQADGWDVKFEEGNEVRFLAMILCCVFIGNSTYVVAKQLYCFPHIWNNGGFALGISP